MPKVGKRKISFRRKPGGSKVGNAIRKARAGIKKGVKSLTKKVYKKQVSKKSPLGIVKTTKTYKNPLTGRKRKVVKEKISVIDKATGKEKVNRRGKVKYRKMNKKVQVTKRQKGSIGKRRVVKTKEAYYSPNVEHKRVPTSKVKKAVKYNRKHVEKDKTVTKARGHRVKKQTFTGVPRTQRKSVRRIIK
tara:strand:- start:180 stop:746 length:567 start_codon:yes stop_codon:yes gene_type:complete